MDRHFSVPMPKVQDNQNGAFSDNKRLVGDVGMSENGEFKKRIAKIEAEAHIEACKSILSIPPITEEHLKKLDIFGNVTSLVDEAAKEFPKVNASVVEWSVQANYWFWKWFGSKTES